MSGCMAPLRGWLAVPLDTVWASWVSKSPWTTMHGVTSPCIFPGFCQSHQAAVMEAEVEPRWAPGVYWFLHQQGAPRGPNLSSRCGGLTTANSPK